MRCLAVCQDELVIRMLDEILLPGFEVEFIVENKPAARRLHETGVTVFTGDPRRAETWIKADLGLILLHNEPDPDAMASGLALRNILRRTKTTAIIGAIQGVTRPENVRMINLLDIHVETITPATVTEYDRVAMVDVQPHYFGGLGDR